MTGLWNYIILFDNIFKYKNMILSKMLSHEFTKEKMNNPSLKFKNVKLYRRIGISFIKINDVYNSMLIM